MQEELTITQELEDAYCQMAEDKTRDAEALEWLEATIGDTCRAD